MEDGHGGEVDVHRVPQVTHEGPEEPGVGQLDRGVEDHGHESHQHVGQGHGHHEVVGDDPQLVVPGREREREGGRG